MQRILSLLMLMLLSSPITYAGKWEFTKDPGSGTFSLGTRNAISLFNDIPGETPGVGIGGQLRVQFSDRINTEWFLDYLTSNVGSSGIRNDYHVGWSLMYYLSKNGGFENFLKPYLIAGHCFDKTELFSRHDKSTRKSRLSMATQAGLGNHFNITPQLDFTISTQYMLHFGKELHAHEEEGKFIVEEETHTKPGGHLLTVLSINYKFAKLW